MKVSFLILALLLFLTPMSRAEENAAEEESVAPPAETATTSNTDAKAKKSGVKVLDFEADVIEGERKAPNLFVQLETESPDLDTLIYRRHNFNDFHERERTRRPVYRKPSP